MSYLKNKTLFLSSFAPLSPILESNFFSIYSHLQFKLCLVRLDTSRDGTSTKPRLQTSAYYSKQLPVANGLLTKLRILISRSAAQRILSKVYMHSVYLWGL